MVAAEAFLRKDRKGGNITWHLIDLVAVKAGMICRSKRQDTNSERSNDGYKMPARDGHCSQEKVQSILVILRGQLFLLRFHLLNAEKYIHF